MGPGLGPRQADCRVQALVPVCQQDSSSFDSVNRHLCFLLPNLPAHFPVKQSLSSLEPFIRNG